MMLNKPNYNFQATLKLCKKGITGNASFKQKIAGHIDSLIPLGGKYRKKAKRAKLYKIQPLQNSNLPVIGNLTGIDLIKLYGTYMVPEKNPARKIYDALMIEARNGCPFCGGIGIPRNIDHFLPKSDFPQFSVLPLNLIPSCRDCNVEKGNQFASIANDQIIHPYLDKPRFFKKQWIYANYHEGDVGHFEYYVKPPRYWSRVNKDRVNKHFNDFDIAGRYAIRAGQMHRTVINQINNLIDKDTSKEDIIKDLLIPGMKNCDFVNHWQYVMYQALIDWLKNKYP